MPTPSSRPLSRASIYLLAVLIFGLTLACMNRVYAVGNTPNAILVRYNLTADTELPIQIPVVNQPVHVMATCETIGVRGIAFTDVLRVDSFLMWTGKNSPGGAGGSNNSGYGGDDGTRMATVNFNSDVHLEVQNASTMAIRNNSGGARAGYVTLIW